MVDRDALLRKAVDKLCDSTASLKVEQRDAVVSLLDGHDVLAVLPTGFGKSLIFQAFVLAAEMERERLQTALVLCPLQSIINDQISEARNMGLSASNCCRSILGGVEICKMSTTVWFSRKGARGTSVKCPERQLFFNSPTFGSNCNRRVTYSGDVDREKVFPHYEVQFS